jgi:uncharacterized protein (DUF488 family)
VPRFFTIGHSTRPVEAFVALLAESSVAIVVDVRTAPRSRTNPQYNRDALPATLAAAGVDYTHLASLGGLRPRSRDISPEVNGYWENASFHNYADYALSAAFADGLAALREIGHARRATVMCSEAVWWRCHRRIVADWLIAAGESVVHIMAPGKTEIATMTPGGVRNADGSVTYPSLL